MVAPPFYSAYYGINTTYTIHVTFGYVVEGVLKLGRATMILSVRAVWLINILIFK